MITVASQYIIHAQDVENRLCNINITKAQGPDFLPSWILRDFAPLLAQPLAAIYNASVREGIVPHVRKSAIVVPVPKVHPPKSTSSDLRPISQRVYHENTPWGKKRPTGVRL